MRLCEFRKKEVINVCDCSKLGYVVDIEFDECRNCITAIIVPGQAKICRFFGRDKEYVIPWNCIRQIGDEIILVSVNLEEVYVGIDK